MLQFSNSNRVMRLETISKNGVNLKNQVNYYIHSSRKIMCFLMIVLLFFGTGSVIGQSNNGNLLRDLSKRDNKVFILVENIDSVENFSQTVMKYMKNSGYWKIVDYISDADMVLQFTGFRININGYPHFESYVKVFDNKMNFIYRGDYVWKSGTIWGTFEQFFDKTLQALVNNLPSNLKNAHISKTSPFYVASTKAKPYNEVEFAKYHHLLSESIEYKQNKKILANVDRCIRINPELPVLYAIKSAILIEMNKKSFESINKLIELEPLNDNIDYLWQAARNQKSAKNVKIMAVSNAVSTSLNTLNASFSQRNINNINSTGSSMSSSSSDHSSDCASMQWRYKTITKNLKSAEDQYNRLSQSGSVLATSHAKTVTEMKQLKESIEREARTKGCTLQ